jgi:peptidyl-prolyl cis-trans isomerase B (cyclophilin B)
LARRALADFCEEQGQLAEANEHRAVAGVMDVSDVVMVTSLGDIFLKFDAQKAPLTVTNFLSYVDEAYYDGTTFHRVIDGFVIQGGGMLPGPTPKGGTKPPIKNESPNGLSNKRGTVAMARTADPDSGNCQFYINVVDNSAHLDRSGYCVFGVVTGGLDVVDRIKSVPTTRKAGHSDVPVDDIVISFVRRIQ